MKCLLFNFGYQECQKNSWKYFLHLYKFMDYNKVWFSRSTFHEKAKKNLQSVLFCWCRVKGHIANFCIFLDVFEFLLFGWFFLFFKEFGFLGILGPPGNHTSQWIRDLWLKGISLILAYFEMFLSFCVLDDFSHFLKQFGSPFCGIGASIRIGQDMLFSHMRNFFKDVSEIQKYCKNHVTFCHNMAQRKCCVLFCHRKWVLPMISNTDLTSRDIIN